MKKKNTFLALLLLCSTPYTLLARFKEIKNQQEYENLLNTKKPVILQFAASWCPACKNVKETVEQVAQEPLFNDIIIARLDTDAFPAVAQKYGVQTIPMIVCIDNKGNAVDSLSIGGMNADQLRKTIRSRCNK